jgi:hypothetical protein
VEGHINRLKLIKRQAYGRAGLAYLQRRFAAFGLTDVVSDRSATANREAREVEDDPWSNTHGGGDGVKQ